MKKGIGIVLILIGSCLAFIMKIGPAKETAWMFSYGSLPLIVIAAILLLIGLVLYNKNR